MKQILKQKESPTLQTSKFKELRISKIARSKDGIKTSWPSCTDNLVTLSAPDYPPLSRV